MEKTYNDSQLQAIRHLDGPCLVLAGPGSGKTAVITERAKRLVTEHGVNPANILVITFTKAAALEMKQRFSRLTGGGSAPVTFGTFHAVYFHILKRAYHYRAENIIREEQKYALMRELVQKHRLEYEDENEFVTALLGEIGMVKNTGVSIENYYSANCGEQVFRRLYSEYHEYLYRHKLIDFDDMLVYTYELFSERADILEAWRNKYRYILIDEFQDVNRIQFDVVKMLAAPRNNLFVVGDDDQSIYRFRGAKPELMLHFKDDYPDARQVLLDVNYRSKKPIVDASLRLIGHNRERFPKKIRAGREDGAAEKEAVEYLCFREQKEEYDKIIADIRGHVGRGGKYGDFAVLFRTNTQPQMLTERLLEYNIPFRMKDRIPNLYEHWIAQDIFAYVRIATGSRKRGDFLKIMNRPKRYINRDSLEDETVAFDAWEWFYEEKPWVAKRIRRLEYDVKMLSRMTPYAAINYIRKGIGYDEFCAEYADYRRISAEDLYEVLDGLQEAAKGFDSYDEWFSHIARYGEELKRRAAEKNSAGEGVALATLHGAKGLEYENVYIIDVNEGVMPYKKAVLESELEEERRMFYVGMTRARERLHIYSVRQFGHRDAEVSRFVMEAMGEGEKGEEKAGREILF